MNRQTAWFVSVLGALGCSSTTTAKAPGQTGGDVLVIGAPSPSAYSASSTATGEVSEGGAGSEEPAPGEFKANASTIPERCAAYERRDPAAGALAWISECRIKTIKPIYFQFNSDVIHAESELILQAVADIMLGDSSLRVEIGAHSDGRGSRQHNAELTQKRADAVKVHLVSKGVDAERLIARGFGEEQMISHPPLIDGQRTNRRIEFVILAK